MIDLGPTVEALAGPIQILRKSGGSYNAQGKWVGEQRAPEDATAVVQPATGSKLLDLPEGERFEAQFFMWTRSALTLDDMVVHDGSKYRILHAWPRPEGGFTRAVLGSTYEQ
jgi:hypothetical protein